MNEQTEMDFSMTTAELDTLIRSARDLKMDYDEKYTISKEAKKRYEEVQSVIIDTLTKLNKKKYSVDGLGTVTRVAKFSVKTPKTIEDKKLFANWCKEKGEEFFWSYYSVNSRSLNSLYNTETEQAAEKGEMFFLPGTEEPSCMEHLMFKKEAK